MPYIVLLIFSVRLLKLVITTPINQYSSGNTNRALESNGHTDDLSVEMTTSAADFVTQFSGDPCKNATNVEFNGLTNQSCRVSNKTMLGSWTLSRKTIRNNYIVSGNRWYREIN